MKGWTVNWLHAVILGIVEGITEFLPVSSTGHLRIVEKLLGYDIQGAGITAFTAIIQVGAILAAIEIGTTVRHPHDARPDDECPGNDPQ